MLYDRLFNVDLGGAGGRRATLLDAVLDDAASARPTAQCDRARLDAHMEHLFEVQRRLSLGADACTTPDAPGEATDLAGRAAIISELLVTALACGQTRVFSYMLTSPASTRVFSEVDVSTDMHTVCHAGYWDEVDRITQVQMEAFADLLDRRPTPPTPRRLAARPGSGLRPVGIWRGLPAQRDRDAARAGRTRRRATANRRACARRRRQLRPWPAHGLQALGLDIPEFGFGGAQTSSPFTELLA